MQASNIESFLEYFEKVRERTLKVIAAAEPQHFDWTYAEGKFTFGDIVRHLGAIERWMYAENAQCKPSLYPGHGKEVAVGYADPVEYLNAMHAEALEIFRKLTPEDLNKRCATPAGAAITVWKWLRLMAEHEIHHRGQLFLYLSMLGVPTVPIFGLTSEEVRERSV